VIARNSAAFTHKNKSFYIYGTKFTKYLHRTQSLLIF